MILTKKQTLALDLLEDKVTTEVLYGGAAGGGKSALGCLWQIQQRVMFKGTRGLIGRAEMRSLKETTLQTFFWVADQQGLKLGKHYDLTSAHHTTLPNCIVFRNGSFIYLKDLKYMPSDPNFTSLGSLELTDAFIEECGEITFKAKDVLTSRIRFRLDEYDLLPKLLMTANPTKNWLYSTIYVPHREGRLPEWQQFVQALPGDNPHLSVHYLRNLSRLDPVTRERLLQGNWDYEDDPLALIDYSAIVDLFTNDYIRPDERNRTLVADVAMYGSDLFRVGVFYGDVLIEHFSMKKSGGRQIIQEIKRLQQKHQIRASKILYDADGVGAFVGGSGGFIRGAVAFHANASPLKRKTDKTTEYANLKAQCGFLLAEKINDGLMYAPCVYTEADREILSEELSQIKKDKADSDGKLRLKPKSKIIDDLGRSPDFADLFLMNQYFSITAAIKPAVSARPLSTG